MKWTAEVEDEIDYKFIQRVIKEVTKSCALPFKLPVECIPEYILQAAGWFWENVDMACEERLYIIPNSALCKDGQLNKIVQLPQQIMGVHGVFKIQEHMKYGAMGDFSLERMMMSSYSMFGGSGTVGGGFNGTTGMAGYTLTDVVTSMYEVSTFDQYLNAPLTYSFNPNSSKLNIMGDLGWSDMLINCMVRCTIQDLYNNPYFFRLVTSYVKQALEEIYTTWEFKLPGGITINFDKISSKAEKDEEKVEEWAERNRAADYFFMPGTL